MSKIKAILFDADGVIQKPSRPWREFLEELSPDPLKADDFISDIFAAERPCLSGKGNFVKQFQVVLEKYQSEVPIDEALKVWTFIKPDMDILEFIRKLKNNHIVCLASNQNEYRANYMSFELGYEGLFNYSFYSCYLGSVKPSEEYFLKIKNQLNLEDNNILFIDDDRNNVEAALETGICAELFNIDSKVEGLKCLLANHDIEIP
jgi:putative hydrolase of the HAD superfamily